MNKNIAILLCDMCSRRTLITVARKSLPLYMKSVRPQRCDSSMTWNTTNGTCNYGTDREYYIETCDFSFSHVSRHEESQGTQKNRKQKAPRAFHMHLKAPPDIYKHGGILCRQRPLCPVPTREGRLLPKSWRCPEPWLLNPSLHHPPNTRALQTKHNENLLTVLMSVVGRHFLRALNVAPVVHNPVVLYNNFPWTSAQLFGSPNTHLISSAIGCAALPLPPCVNTDTLRVRQKKQLLKA